MSLKNSHDTELASVLCFRALRLKTWRVASGRSLLEFAQELGVATATARAYEGGSAIPRLALFRMRQLGVPEHVLNIPHLANDNK